MNYKIIIEPKAELDIAVAVKWYNNQQKSLGKKFKNELQKKISLIAKSPLVFAIRYSRNIRTAILAVFPYSIHYIIDDNKNTVFILAVLHNKRNPKDWPKSSTL